MDPGNDAIWIAAIVAFFGCLTAAIPMMTARQTNRATAAALDAANRRSDILAERMQRVAAKAEVSAGLIATNTQDVARSLRLATEAITDGTKKTDDKLDVLHLLVNSQYTAAKQAEYDATVREAATIAELIDMKRATGKEPTVHTVTALDAANVKIGELRLELDERIKQAKLVITQQAIQKTTD